ncbi:MAG: SAVED domain-containing protein [Actinomycetota bacterium]
MFISYRQSDGTPLAVALAWALRAAGVPVWHDQTDLPPGDTAKRLQEALASGLSGAILVVTPQIADSKVVREVELPALLDLAKDPAFTLSIVSTISRPDQPGMLDYGAPDRLLGVAAGTLSAIEQSPGVSGVQRADVARRLARRRLEHLRPAIADGGELVLDLQTRVPPFAAQHDAHLVVRLRPPMDGHRRPDARGLADLQAFLGQLPQLVAISGASQMRVRGGAHLSVACAFGAAVPTTLMGSVEVVDTSGKPWLLAGQAPSAGPERVLVPVSPPSHNHDRGPVLVYVDLLPQRSDAAYDDLVAKNDFASVVHMRPVAAGLLEPGEAGRMVGDVIAAVREIAGSHGTTEVHLLLRCPYPVALLIGRCLNTLTVHLYEWEDAVEGDAASPRYVPSVVLRSGAGGSPVDRVSAPSPPDSEEL